MTLTSLNLLTGFALFLGSFVVADGTGRIVGGENADIRDIPYQLALLGNEFLTCGAVIISPKYALTAGQCTIRTSELYMYVRAGSANYQSGGQKIKVKKIHQHPNSSLWNLDYDLSVLELQDQLVFDENVQAIKLPESGETLDEGTPVVTSGWGTLYEGAITLPTDLQCVEVNVIGNEKCQEAYYYDEVSDRMMCAGVSGGGKDACQGDSGGPLVGNGKLFGLVSWGLGCARPEYPGVYTAITNPVLRAFIKQVAGI